MSKHILKQVSDYLKWLQEARETASSWVGPIVPCYNKAILPERLN